MLFIFLGLFTNFKIAVFKSFTFLGSIKYPFFPFTIISLHPGVFVAINGLFKEAPSNNTLGIPSRRA